MIREDAKGNIIVDPRARIIKSGGSGGGGGGSVTSVNGKTGVVVLDHDDVGAAASSHNHDSRYYTETETNTLLAGKANASHTHTKSQVTDFPTGVSAFTNDAGYLTSHQSLAAYRTSSAQDAIDAGKVNEPASEGTSGQVLTTNGAGGRTWTTVGGGGGGVTMNTLWTNPSMTASFSPQTINISGDEYNLFLVVYSVTNVATPTFVANAFFLKGQQVCTLTESSSYDYKRTAKITGATAVFENAYRNTTVNNTYMIPYKIYGISGITIS